MTSRSRTCTDPIPVFGGKRCDVLGLPVETKECNVHVCPGEEVLKRVVVVVVVVVVFSSKIFIALDVS